MNRKEYAPPQKKITAMQLAHKTHAGITQENMCLNIAEHIL
jgi:hypothetical protein